MDINNRVDNSSKGWRSRW